VRVRLPGPCRPLVYRLRSIILSNLRVKKIKIGEYLSKRCKQKRDCLLVFLRLLAVCWSGARKVRETTMLLLVTVNIFGISHSAINLS